MTDQERNQVLKMIQDGKISPEEGLRLLQALEQSPAEDLSPAEKKPPITEATAPEKPEAEPRAEKSDFAVDPRIARIKSTVHRLWQIPLWIGIGITVLSATGMYFIMRGPGMNFWFFFMILPLLLGVAIIAAAVGTHKARWIFVDVHEKHGEHPQRIFLGFPLPLKFAAWFLRTFGHRIPDLRNTNVDEVIQIVETGLGKDEPLIVNVDEGEEGDKVRVYIG